MGGNHLLEKGTRDISAFFNSFRNSDTCNDMFRKVAFLGISRCSILAGVASLQSRVCNPTKNEPLTKFLEDALELAENVHEGICIEVFFSKL